MRFLIDGYNVLHVAGILGRGVGPGGLERARFALLNFLAESLDPQEVPRTIVVFDARHSPPGLSPVTSHRGLTVRFAKNYDDADALIEELIRTESAPRRLTVVSSDHRLQRAARRRRARAVDSDVWCAEVARARRERRQASPIASPHPSLPLLEEDVAYWIRQFGGEAALAEVVEEAARGAKRSVPTARAKDDKSPPALPGEKPLVGQSPEVDNPFPPGYAEDVEDEG